ncbi:MAG: hypothetical protein NXI04_29515 [Planctomycetaceae bacterium]|nr:hypothetical protein [Planctomycetaceae bacterium]
MRISPLPLLVIGVVLTCSVCSACPQDTDTKAKHETAHETKHETRSERKLDPAAAVAERFVKSFVERHDVDAALRCVSSPFYRIDGSVQANLKRFDSDQKTRRHLASVIGADSAIRRRPQCRFKSEFTVDLRAVLQHKQMKVPTRDMKSRWEQAGLFGPRDRAFEVNSEYFIAIVIVAKKDGQWQVTGYGFHHAR